MKLLIDVCIGAVTEKMLQTILIGDDVKLIRNLNPKMPDEEIIEIANSEKRLIITSDKDFGELVFQNNYKHCGILLLRLDNLSAVEKANLLIEILKNHAEQLPDNFSVYKKGILRIRNANHK